MFYVRYILSELRHRKGRTTLTVLGLAVGVSLVVAVMALSNGLDKAQSEILKPLTGVGTEMTVTRPVQASGSGSDQSFSSGNEQLSESEQNQLREENGDRRLDLQNLGDPGESFTTENFTASQLSFPASNVTKIAQQSGVKAVAAGLTLNVVQISGEIPEESQQNGGGGPPAQGGPGGPSDIDFQQLSIAGVDTSNQEIGLLKASEVKEGSYFTSADGREAVVSKSYSQRKKIEVGEKIKVKGRSYSVVGIAELSTGAETSDIYIPLAQLQKISDRKDRINTVTVETESTDQVDQVSAQIESTVSGSEVATADDVAERISGSLLDAKNLSGKLGAALAAVALIAAFAIASLLTLTAVNKRTRELGTLKAIGWSKWQVVRQITGESLAQGLLGGVIGAGLGLGISVLVGAFGPKLSASIEPATEAVGFGGPGGRAPGAVEEPAAAVTSVDLTAPVDIQLILLAIGLAVVGGLIAGAVGASRAARLSPAQALRSVA